MASGVTKAWTREEIEAWVDCKRPGDDRHFLTPPSGPVLSARAIEIRMAGRRALLRYAPECPDYAALSRRLYVEQGLTWHVMLRADEIAPRVERALAALWQQSLEASDEHR